MGGHADPAGLDTVLGKAVALLRAFTPEDQVLTLAELCRRTALPKGTVHRIAGDLVGHQLLDRVPAGYRLSGGLFELGMRAAVERTLLELAMPFLQDLYERTHETVHLGVAETGVAFEQESRVGLLCVAAPGRSAASARTCTSRPCGPRPRGSAASWRAASTERADLRRRRRPSASPGRRSLTT